MTDYTQRCPCGASLVGFTITTSDAAYVGAGGIQAWNPETDTATANCSAGHRYRVLEWMRDRGGIQYRLGERVPRRPPPRSKGAPDAHHPTLDLVVLLHVPPDNH